MIYTLIIVILVTIYFVVTYNTLIKLNNSVKEAFSTLDVYLKKRWDLIPNIVETVKGYAKHEKETLQSVVGLRSGDYSSLSPEEKIEANKNLDKSMSNFQILVENYPELKADKNYLELSSSLTNIENEISQSRKYYNAVVKEYNNKTSMFPSNIVAGIFGFSEKPMFEASENEREAVKVKLW